MASSCILSNCLHQLRQGQTSLKLQVSSAECQISPNITSVTTGFLSGWLELVNPTHTGWSLPVEHDSIHSFKLSIFRYKQLRDLLVQFQSYLASSNLKQCKIEQASSAQLKKHSWCLTCLCAPLPAPTHVAIRDFFPQLRA